MSVATLAPTTTLGPLTAPERTLIMAHARGLAPETRRTFRRLLILAQAQGLSAEVITRSAVQAQEHSTR